jgi:hypothetical protein
LPAAPLPVTYTLVTPTGTVNVPEVLNVWLPAFTTAFPPNIAILEVPAGMFKPQS